MEALASILGLSGRIRKEKYVIMSEANLAANFDFKAMLNAHIESAPMWTLAYAQGGNSGGADQTLRCE